MFRNFLKILTGFLLVLLESNELFSQRHWFKKKNNNNSGVLAGVNEVTIQAPVHNTLTASSPRTLPQFLLTTTYKRTQSTVDSRD
jgi:hypothetical protein